MNQLTSILSLFGEISCDKSYDFINTNNPITYSPYAVLATETTETFEFFLLFSLYSLWQTPLSTYDELPIQKLLHETMKVVNTIFAFDGVTPLQVYARLQVALNIFAEFHIFFLHVIAEGDAVL